METHHPHLNHQTGKIFSHYFYEFLMLFLAVTLGFIVENQREHFVEQTRAHEFVISLLEDLQKDTIEILDVMREDKIILACFDSISSIVHQGLENNKVPGSFYYYCNTGTSSPTVGWNDATLVQITQTGSLRYFKNTDLIKKISFYFSQIDYVRGLNNADRNLREKTMEIRSKILNNYYYSRFSSYSTESWLNVPESLMNNIFPLQTNDANLLNEFANSYENRRRLLILEMNKVYPNSIKNARELMEVLKIEYHLE